MEDSKIIRYSASYGILKFIYSCLLESFSYLAVSAILVSLTRSGRNAFALSECRKFFYSACAVCKSNFYTVAGLTLCVLLLCNLALSWMIYGEPSYSNMAILILALSVMSSGITGAFDRFLAIMRNSMAFCLLRVKI